MRRLLSLIVTSLVVGMPVLAWGQASPPPPATDQARALQLEALQTVAMVLLDPTRSEADRLGAATALVKNADRTAMPLLTGLLLGDRFASVRRAIAEGLGRYRAPEAAFSLRQAALSDPIDSVRWAAGVSLLQTDPSQTDVLGTLLAHSDTLSAAALSLQEAAGFAALPTAFHDTLESAFIRAFPDRGYNLVERAAMLKALGRLQSQAAVGLMMDVLQNDNEDPFVRGAAAFSLGTLGVQRAVPALIAVLNNDSEALQVGALGALGRLKNTQALFALTQVLNHEDSAEVRAAAAAALGALGERSLPSLIDALNVDPDPNVRQAAVSSLALMDDPDAGEAVRTFALGNYLTTCDPQACSGLALATLSALAKLGQGDLAVSLLENSLAALEDVLPFVFAFAEEQLIEVAVQVAQAAPQVLDVLLGSDNAFVQAIGLATLAQVKGEFARATLLPFTAPDAHRLLRRMAFEGLAPWARPEDFSSFNDELTNRDRRTRAAAFSALMRIGGAQTAASFSAALASPDLATSLQAVEAAFQFGNRILASKQP